ncbi:hypothetical protein LVT19_31035, partial [Klebsiella pneumoniae]|nr:hypothetical protein [Klebsiella pneumoniae]
ACYGIKIDHTERETTGVVGKAERLTWHKAWTMVSTGFSISYTSSVSGDWRTLNTNYIFKIREFDANLAVMLLTLKPETVDTGYMYFHYEDRVYVLTQAIKAFLLAAKLRREVGLPDSIHLKGKQGVLFLLHKARKRYWRLVHCDRKNVNGKKR